MTVFNKQESFDSEKELFTCNRCTDFLSQLEGFTEELGLDNFFSRKNEPSLVDKSNYLKVNAISKAFEVAEESEVESLKTWYQTMKELIKLRECICKKC